MSRQFSSFLDLNKTDVQDLWYPIHKTYRFFGLLNFAMEYEGNSFKTVTKLFDIILLTVGILFNLLCLYCCLFSNMYMKTDVKLLNYGNQFFFILCIAVSLILRIQSFIIKHEIGKLIILFTIVDDEVNQYNH